MTQPICSCNDFQHDTDICDVHGKKGQEPAPREFWLVRNPILNSFSVHETKPSWKSIPLGHERTHVIEYSAYQKLLEEIERLKNERI